jgi:hypothetical protein
MNEVNNEKYNNLDLESLKKIKSGDEYFEFLLHNLELSDISKNIQCIVSFFIEGKFFFYYGIKIDYENSLLRAYIENFLYLKMFDYKKSNYLDIKKYYFQITENFDYILNLKYISNEENELVDLSYIDLIIQNKYIDFLNFLLEKMNEYYNNKLIDEIKNYEDTVYYIDLNISLFFLSHFDELEKIRFFYKYKQSMNEKINENAPLNIIQESIFKRYGRSYTLKDNRIPSKGALFCMFAGFLGCIVSLVSRNELLSYKVFDCLNYCSISKKIRNNFKNKSLFCFFSISFCFSSYYFIKGYCLKRHKNGMIGNFNLKIKNSSELKNAERVLKNNI